MCVGRNEGMYTTQEFQKNVLKPNAFKFTGSSTLHKLYVAHIYMHSNIIYISIVYTHWTWTAHPLMYSGL